MDTSASPISWWRSSSLLSWYPKCVYLWRDINSIRSGGNRHLSLVYNQRSNCKRLRFSKDAKWMAESDKSSVDFFSYNISTVVSQPPYFILKKWVLLFQFKSVSRVIWRDPEWRSFRINYAASSFQFQRAAGNRQFAAVAQLFMHY